MLKGRKIISKHHHIDITSLNIKPVINSFTTGIDNAPIIKIKKNSKKIKISIPKLIYSDGKSKLPMTIFFILILLAGLYVINDQFIKNKNASSTTEYTASKIDNSKSYVYFSSTDTIMTGLNDNITYTSRNIVININTDAVKSLNSTLNSENAEFIKQYKYSSDSSYLACYPNKSSYNTQNKNLISFTYRTYTVFENKTYISILVTDTPITLCQTNNTKTFKSYIIDKKTGAIMTSTSILSLFNTTYEELIKTSISTRSEDAYKVDNKEEIVNKIISNNQIALYVDNNSCLGIYYQGILTNDYINYDVCGE